MIGCGGADGVDSAFPGSAALRANPHLHATVDRHDLPIRSRITVSGAIHRLIARYRHLYVRRGVSGVAGRDDRRESKDVRVWPHIGQVLIEDDRRHRRIYHVHHDLVLAYGAFIVGYAERKSMRP